MWAPTCTLKISLIFGVFIVNRVYQVMYTPIIEFNLKLLIMFLIWIIEEIVITLFSETPANMTTQMLYFSILVSSLVLYSIFSATITSYIAVLTNDLPFSTYEEFRVMDDYKLTIIQGSRDEQLVVRIRNYFPLSFS